MKVAPRRSQGLLPGKGVSRIESKVMWAILHFMGFWGIDHWFGGLLEI